MINAIKTVFKKEWKDTRRDRRTVLAAMAYSLLGPAMLLIILNFAAGLVEDSKDPVIAMQNGMEAPQLTAYLKGEGYEIKPFDKGANPLDGIGEVDALLTIMPGYATAMNAGKGATVRIYADGGSNSKRLVAQKLSAAVSQFGSQIVDGRMIANGMPPGLKRSIMIEQADLSVGGARAKQFSFMLIYFFILAPFFSSLSVAIDTAAGERERKSLQTLLVQPISPLNLVIGKWMLAAMFGMLGTALTVFGGLNALSFAPIDVLGIKFNLDLLTQVKLFIALMPLALMVASLQIWVSLMAKSYKEANTYMQLMSFAPVLIGVSLELKGEVITGFFANLPIVAQLQGARTILIEGGAVASPLIFGGLFCVSVAIIGLMLTAKKLQSEKILSAA